MSQPLTTPPRTDGFLIDLITYTGSEMKELHDLPIDELLAEIKPDRVNWLNLDGLKDRSIIDSIGNHFNLHALLVDDLITENSPKAEEYDAYLFFTLKMVHSINEGHIEYEQASFVLGQNYLLSFQEKRGDFFDEVRTRLRSEQSWIRKTKADYLLYRLLEIIINRYFAVLEDIGDRIEEVEEAIIRTPDGREFRNIQNIKKELIYLRKALYPLREALNKITRGESDFVNRDSMRYFSDLHDHVTQLTGTLDTYRDLTTSLMDIHINSLNTRMNEVMKVLAIISTIFMPLTFIVGVYGMNFDHMPELRWTYGYGGVMVVMFAIVIAMVMYFRHKKWF
ncbi:MAG: magnesium/cobalt transporter CorA [Bacteroidota bacterium]